MAIYQRRLQLVRGVNYAPPTLTSATPETEAQGATSQAIALVGTRFVNGQTAVFSNSGITVNSTTFNSSTSLTANITVSGGASTGNGTVKVHDATRGDSNTLSFAVTSGGITPLPSLSRTVLERWHAGAGTSTTTNGAGVASWTGQMNSSVVAQATGANQPTYAAASVNGKPSIAFAGSQWLASSGALALFNVLNQSVFVIAKVTGGAGTTRKLLSYRDTAAHTGYALDINTSNAYRLIYEDGTTGHNFAGGAVDGSVHTVATILDQSAPTKQDLRLDNASLNSGALGFVQNTTSAVVAGAADVAGANSLIGNLCEIIWLSGAASTADKTALETYAQGEWGTP